MRRRGDEKNKGGGGVVRSFMITFVIFLILRYYLAEIVIGNKPNMKEGIIKSICYGLAYIAASKTL